MLRVRDLLIISAILFLVHDGDAAFRSPSVLQGGGGRGYNRQQYTNNLNYKAAAVGSNLGGLKNQGYAHSADIKSDVVHDAKGGRAHAFSAWGIVAIIIGVILLGTGGYYAFVFYPFVCRKERNYDMIELTHVL